MLTIVGLILMLASGGEASSQFWIWMAVLVILDGLIIKSWSSGTKGRNEPKRIGVIDKYLFDKGMTYNNGHEYEKYVAWWLGTKGYRNIQITPKSGDYGADIICYGRRGEKYAVQCKYYSKPVGYRAVEEVLGAMHYYGCNEAMVVTNSTYTKQALTAANRSGVKLIERVR